jgi:hypothetical protein
MRIAISILLNLQILTYFVGLNIASVAVSAIMVGVITAMIVQLFRKSRELAKPTMSEKSLKAYKLLV